QVLQGAGWTETEYFEARGSEARREQILRAVLADTALPAVATDLINDYAASTRTIDYITLSDANLEPPAAPTEAARAADMAEHQGECRTVETRTVTLLDLSVASLAATLTVDDAQIAAEYERFRATLTTPERRTIAQLPLNTPELEAQFEAGLAAGTDFGTLIAEEIGRA